jgi:O-antigen polymerase
MTLHQKSDLLWSAKTVALAMLCTLLVAAPYFWPFLWGPVPEMWPNLFAWAVGGSLIFLLPLLRARVDIAVVSGWLIAALGSAVLGTLQYFDLENALYPWVVPTLAGFSTANLHQFNMLATMLAVGLLCVWWLVSKNYIKALNGAWMAGLLLFALAATASRTGLIHLMAISCMLLYWQPGQWKRLLLIIAAGWALYTVAAKSLPWLVWVTRGIVVNRDLISRFGEEVGCHSRRQIWSNVIDLISVKPWTGWGSGELLYAHYISDFGADRFCDKLSNAHNLPLHMAFSMGVPVTLVLLVLCVWAIAKLRPWAATDPLERMCWGVLVLLGLHSMLEYPLWYGVFQLMGGLAIWLIYKLRTPIRHAPPAHVARFSAVRAVTAGLLLSGLALVAWDYIKVSQLYTPQHLRLEGFRTETLSKSQSTWLFQPYVLIAQITTLELRPENAGLILEASLSALHTAPDSQVIRKVIESAALVGRADLVALHLARYKAAWPREYEEWLEQQKNAAAVR